MTEHFSNEILKTIPESAVVDEVKKVIKQTGLKVQRINTGCFVIGSGRNRRYINEKGGVAFVAHSGAEALENLQQRGCLIGTANNEV